MDTLKESLLVILFFPVLGFTQSSFRLLDDYNFLQREGKIFQLKQSNDTLFEIRKSVFDETFTELRKHYKIHGFSETSDYHLLKLERLDTIPLTTKPYPLTRYLIIAIRLMNERQLGYLPLAGGLTKPQMDSFSIHNDSLNHKFFYTYFSNKYISEFSALKEIKTKKDANKIIRLAKSKRYKDLLNSWKKTTIGDFYGTILTAELINSACLEMGYNPLTADVKITSLIKKP